MAREPEQQIMASAPIGRAVFDVVLNDGVTAQIRAIHPDDADALRTFHASQSRESNYTRYFSAKPTLSDAEVARFTSPDFSASGGLVAIENDQLVGTANWFRWPGRNDAEVAFQVDDAHKGRGIASLLLEHLAASATAAGVNRFTAETMGDNRSMLAVFSRAGWPVQRTFASGVVELAWSLDDVARFVERVGEREHRADSRAMARLLLPRSIAIVGASDRVGSVGHAVTTAMLSSDFAGPVYLVNPNRAMVAGRTAFAAMGDIGELVDLALVVVPESSVGAVIDDCAGHHVRGAIIISAVEITDLAALVGTARNHGMRIIGPDSMGALATAPGAAFQASLAPRSPRPGTVALSVQSGGLGAALLDLADRVQLGLSWFVSLGDRADVSGNDLLQFWDDDDNTTVIGMYTERFGNPRKFARIARRVARRRPIVAVTADDGDLSSALYLQAGVISVPSVRDLIDTVRVLATQPLPDGPRVAVVANERSPGRFTRHSLATIGLEPVEPTVAASWRTTPDQLFEIVKETLGRSDVDALVVVFTPLLFSDHAAAAEAVERAAFSSNKPVVAVMLARGDGLVVDNGAVPSFSFPEAAAGVLGRMWAYRQWKTAMGQADELVESDTESVRPDILADRSPGQVNLVETLDALAKYGIRTAPTRLADGADAAVDAATELGFPVAVKSFGARLAGRSAAAGVALDLATESSVRGAVDLIRIGVGPGPLLVQKMVEPGIDVRVRAFNHPALGPVVAVGRGGRLPDALPDAVTFVASASRAEMVHALRGSRIEQLVLAENIELGPLVDIAERASTFACDVDELDLLDLNPVLLSANGCTVVDVTLHLREPADLGPLRRL